MRVVYLHGFGGDRKGPLAIDKGFQQPRPIIFDLPGFGQQPDVDLAQCKNWSDYAHLVMKEINKQVPIREKIKIIGHSHGAMIAFVLATLYPNKVKEILLLCPLAGGTLLSRSFLSLLQATTTVFGWHAIVGLLSNRYFVDLVSRMSYRKSWTKADLERIINQRRQESKRYTPAMLELMARIRSFRPEFSSSFIDTKATLVFAKGDLIVSGSDAQWYKQHLNNAYLMPTKLEGGHLMPDIHPQALAKLLKKHKRL